jgi:peptidoglycan/xylan/chitin deacetylase (PgdA/CDA1 family)
MLAVTAYLCAAPRLSALPAPSADLGPVPRAGSIVLAGGAEAIHAQLPAAAFRDRAILLCWHTFLGDAAINTDFSLKELASQLDAITALGYRFVSLGDLLAGRVEGSLNVVATMDDGHRTVPAAVEKVFLPRGIKPAVFIYPAIIGSVPYAMTDAEVRRLVEEGCLVGAHGYHHLYVTEDLFKAEPAEFDKEIFKAKTSTEALSGLPVIVYAYPYGAYSPVTLGRLDDAGYAYGILAYGTKVKAGFVYAQASLNADFELPRLVMQRDKWPEIYDFLVRNAGAASSSP